LTDCECESDGDKCKSAFVVGDGASGVSVSHRSCIKNGLPCPLASRVNLLDFHIKKIRLRGWEKVKNSLKGTERVRSK
jgi:hypothetical protein